jgi:outer membrane receptor for ferrienterochelin and colicins
VRVEGGTLATVTDSVGRYHLSGVSAGLVIVNVRVIGHVPVFDTLQVGAGDSLRVDFVLPQAVSLSPVVVTAAKRSQLLDQAITSVAVVSDTQLARRAVNTVDEAIDRVAGVQFLNGQVNIRGSTGYVQGLGARVLMLVDGVPANQGDRGGVNWDLVPVSEVARVEVVKGAGSSLYGSAALGGVVNVITRDIPDGVHFRIRATGGAYANPPHDVWTFRDQTGGHGGVDVTGSYGADRARGSFTAGGRHSDGYREQDGRDHWETFGKVAGLLGGTMRFTASTSWASDQYQTPLLWCTRGTCDDRGQTYQPFRIDTSGRGAFTRSDKGYVTATLERTASERLTWQLRGSWLRTYFINYQPGNNDAAVSNRFGAELRGIVRPSPDSGRVVTVGAEGARSDVASDIFGDHFQNEVAAYGESEQLLGHARITAGARIDFLAVDGGGVDAVVSPRAGVVLPAGPSVVWRASAGRGFRAPSLAERFVSTTVQGLVVIPNPALEPETAWSFELGNTARWSPSMRSDVAVFWTEASDLVEPSVNLSTLQIQFKNVARARLVGLDLALAASPLTPRLTTVVAYAFLYARELAHDTVPERPLAFRPTHLLTLSSDYQWRGFTVGGDFRHTSRFARVELYPDDPRVAGNVLDLRAGYEAGSLAVRCLVSNALNYIYNQVPRTLAPVRTFSVVLTWTY